MNAKRFIAPDMRRALKLVRDELGDNAVILQNKTIPEGVELIATDEEVSAVFNSLQQRSARPQQSVASREAASSNNAIANVPPSSAGTNTVNAANTPALTRKPSSTLDDVMPKDMVLPQPSPNEAATSTTTQNSPPNTAVAQRGMANTSLEQAAQKLGARLFNKKPGKLTGPQTQDGVVNDAAGLAEHRSQYKAENTPQSGQGAQATNNEFGQLLGALVNTETVRYAKKRKDEMGAGLLPAEQVAQIRESVAENYNVVIDTLKEEVDLLRRLLTTQAAEQRWEQFSCTQPLKAHLLQQLIGAGYLPNLARRWVEALESPEDLKSGWKGLLKMMLSALPTTADGLFAHNEAVALVGPTGSGKTSTIGKLAAAFVLNGKTDELAIISTDAYRIGAQDQLRTLCQIIGVPLTIVDDHLSLRRALARYAGKRKVLVDTAGLTQQDSAWQLQMRELESCRQSFASYMVVSTTNQLSVHVKALQDYASLPLSGCILTKLDECGRLGDSLSAVMQAQLPIAFTTSGMRIPEDLECADALKLIKHSLSGSLGDCFDPLLAQSCFDSVQSAAQADGAHGQGQASGRGKDVESLLNVCGL